VNLAPQPQPQHPQRGFSLVELSMVLVVIAVIVGAVMSAGSIHRNAVTQRMYSDFALGWRAAYLSYVAASHNVQPGDNPSDPGYAIGGVRDMPLCGEALINTMLALGVTLPQGRAPDQPDRYVYTDTSGSPHELQVCLETVAWSVPGDRVGVYQALPRHVLVLNGLTPEVAATFDAMTDGNVDARFGDLREARSAADTDPQSRPWSADATATMGGVSEGASVELSAYMLVGG